MRFSFGFSFAGFGCLVCVGFIADFRLCDDYVVSCCFVFCLLLWRCDFVFGLIGGWFDVFVVFVVGICFVLFWVFVVFDWLLCAVWCLFFWFCGL